MEKQELVGRTPASSCFYLNTVFKPVLYFRCQGPGKNHRKRIHIFSLIQSGHLPEYLILLLHIWHKWNARYHIRGIAVPHRAFLAIYHVPFGAFSNCLPYFCRAVFSAPSLYSNILTSIGCVLSNTYTISARRKKTGKWLTKRWRESIIINRRALLLAVSPVYD